MEFYFCLEKSWSGQTLTNQIVCYSFDTRIHRYIHMHTSTHTCTCRHIDTHACTDTYIHTLTYIHTRTHTHACTHPPTHTHTHARTHTRTHAHSHTHTHTHTHIETSVSESRPRKVELVRPHENATTTVNILHITTKLVKFLQNKLIALIYSLVNDLLKINYESIKLVEI